VAASLPALQCIAQGGTAVGTGLNTWRGFDARVAALLSEALGLRFTPAANKFEALAAHDALVHAHAALNTLAVSLMKVGL
jgi:fumarate hydratase class II